MKSLVLALISFAVFVSCKKNGTGGDAEIAAFPAHHGRAIKGCTVYVKFKARDLPADPVNNYDLKVVGDPKEDHVHIESLLPGDYYLYAEGYDSSIAHSVKGGLPVSISRKERKKEKDVQIAVSE